MALKSLRAICIIMSADSNSSTVDVDENILAFPMAGREFRFFNGN